MAEALYIGLMSGTSLDGIDAVLVALGDATPRILATYHHPYAPDLRESLLELSHAAAPLLHQLAQVDVQLGQLYAATAQALLHVASVPASAVKAIGCHGQTVRHSPHSTYPYTLQLGDANVIAEQTGITTVADFRRRDIAAGGQGAPLVPAFHAAIFHRADHDRVVLNLGGIANITLLPADAAQAVSGFDTGPANVLLDAWHQRHRGDSYDVDGKWAASGTVLRELLQRLLAEDYFDRVPPKSTGRELFNLAWLEQHLNGAEDPADVQATLLELTTVSVTRAVDRYARSAREVLVCGGGAQNKRLMIRLAESLAPRPVHSTAAIGIEPQWIEAMAFAWLAQRRLEGKPGNLPAVTGAKHHVVLGALYPGG